jgi:hypothetical protein
MVLYLTEKPKLFQRRGQVGAYVATGASTEQGETFARLRLQNLADQDHLATRIEPRPAA